MKSFLILYVSYIVIFFMFSHEDDLLNTMMNNDPRWSKYFIHQHDTLYYKYYQVYGRFCYCISIIMMGFFFDVLTELQQRFFISFVLILSEIIKLIFRGQKANYQSEYPTKIIFDEDVSIQLVFLLSSLNSVSKILFTVTISKWFSRQWFPFYIALFFTCQNIATFFSILTNDCKQTEEDCEVLNFKIALWTSALSIALIVLIFLFLPTNPLDNFIIMGELAMNLQLQSVYKGYIDLRNYK